ncbi:hypothetical protein HG537_0H02650 [Torulaspora globosa]|uniref:non-specific serine/threonine protein kinase n=1 Tax=Torulaspora globosa TaxID=48254 RepID=A0A7H9HYQ1_9SACH|nr:hypothetical protein HG537_0H02650 [Torulaspora sp. CBS 2947]
MLKIKSLFGKKRQQQQQDCRRLATGDVNYVEDPSLVKAMPIIECPVEIDESFLEKDITNVESLSPMVEESDEQLVHSDVEDGRGTREESDDTDIAIEDDSTAATGSSSDQLSVEKELPDEVFREQAELKDYLLINKIGEGAFSRVFRGIPQKNSSKAYLTRNFTEFAIKVIQKDQISGSTIKKDEQTKKSTREQVMKEVQIHKLITCGEGAQNIVQFVDFQETENYYYIVQELLRGGEIFGEIVKYTYFSEDLSRHVIKQLALAVKHMHSMGVVHRDIKPENLLFEPIKHIPSKKPVLRKSDDPATKLDEGEFRPNIGGGGIGVVKLADFGLSKQIYQTNTNTPCGTVGYTAPEVVKDEKYSMEVDMWGIGCVLYTILCGFPPFYDEKIDILTEKISRGEYTFLKPWWDEISDGAKNCVRKLLEVNPEKRYRIDDLLNDEWLNTYDVETTNEKKLSHALDAKRKSKSHTSRKNRVFYLKRDSSLLYSPAANVMRDAFDVSNAVQRNEGDRRNQQQHQDHRSQSQRFGLGCLTEGTEVSCWKSESKDLEQDMFQLKLNSSTIIKRRNENNIPNNTIRIPTLLE